MPAHRLTTKYVEKPWGRFDLPDLFPTDGTSQIGEIWFDGPDGRHPPLLVKYIFTSERLSIQVHPNDEQGRAQGLAGGKNECWLVLDALPDATLGIGTCAPIDAETLRAASLDGRIEQMMDWKPVRAGDFFYIPAGTVHAIGAGITLVEVQQNVDVTYRLYDYGRPRELHLDDGVAVSIATPYGRAPASIIALDNAALLDRDEAPFALRLETFAPGHHVIGDRASPIWFIPLSGSGTCEAAHWTAGQCWMLDESAKFEMLAPCRALIASL